MSAVSIQIYVPNIETMMELYDEIQVHRSITVVGGPYTEITADGSSAATVLGSQTGPFTLDGLTLLVKVDGGLQQTLTFDVTDPVSIDDVVDVVGDELAGVTATEEAGALRLTSDELGTDSIIEIVTGSTALTELGLTVGVTSGKDNRITLNETMETYTYVDNSGDGTYFYKTRYHNSGSGAVSAFSEAMVGDLSSIISTSSLVKCSATFANVDGSPVSEKRISFQNVYSASALSVESIGVVGESVIVETDASGYFETYLVQGAVVDVAIAGTAICRRIVVPDSDFDLFSAIATADDIFQIHEADIPAAPRRS